MVNYNAPIDRIRRRRWTPEEVDMIKFHLKHERVNYKTVPVLTSRTPNAICRKRSELLHLDDERVTPQRRSPDDGLRALLRSHLPMVQWTTIETGGTQSGVPDLEGFCRGAQFWVECKATRASALRFKPAQVGWHLRRAREGGTSFVAVRRRCNSGPHREARDELHIYSGVLVQELVQEGLVATGALGKWAGGAGRWDWDAVLYCLSHSQ